MEHGLERANRVKDICYITASYPYGKGESFIEAEVVEWARKGYRLRIIPMWPRGSFREGARTNGVEVLTYPMIAWRYLLSALYWLLRNPSKFFVLWRIGLSDLGKIKKNVFPILKAFHLARVVSFPADMHIHAHWAGTSSTLGMCLAILKGADWSFTCHRWDIYENNLLRRKALSADFVRFISSRGCNDGVALGVPADKAVVVHMGVEIPKECANEALPTNLFNMLCAANLVKVKGHEYLIRAVKSLRDSGVACVLNVAGDGPLRQELMQLCIDLGVVEAVRFLGHVGHNRLMEMYVRREVGLFVLPSIELPGGEHEGIPVSIMEAMSFGVPVVATRTGSIGELLPESWGTLVPDKDPEALASAIRNLVLNPENYSLVANRQRDVIQKSWSVSASVAQLEPLMACRGSA
jgi:glycosyltransferase involved in cell wall biosynthesis